MTNASELLSAFSHPTRHAIIDLLRQRASTVGELAEQLPVSRPAVSQHLQVLKSIGLVEEERRGTRHYFRLDPKSLAELRTHVEGMWRDALAGFSDFARKESEDARKGRKGNTHPRKRARRLSN
ncbi:MAG: winged helix-turn-helix transcriptional regulator [Acidobacteriaceae bacterium]|nr:winged helix-turn-helix transcriptional regulator [Acidobacteriaceae bacterium]